MTGSTDDSRPGWDALPDPDDAVNPAGLCPRCGRSTTDYVCLHCAAEHDLRGASLVRRFVDVADRYSEEPAPSSAPEPSGEPTPGVHPPTPAATWTAAPTPAGPGRARRGAPAVATRHPLDPSGGGPRGMLAAVAIAVGAILLATVVGIVGAVVTGPGDGGSPGVKATPNR
ncbi:hypothetical protein [Micromonospora purpureochromogenes]|uniref:Uncharacterized protein n=1 Tax=Micromonospora purpureochromogenes TaxID=47872 RepID=A0ABX2RL35_9ACTN|nr:hypothetical protein [Micromonospora purpureochromogenes]NYF55886.1 hypothetical protein [Micromonospora purpureochromogenes]